MKFLHYFIPPIALGMLVLAALLAISGFGGLASAQSTATSTTATSTTGTGTTPTCTLSVNPTSLSDSLGFTTLSWSSNNADMLVIDHDIGTSTFPSSGTRTLFPTTTTTYRATASGANGTTTCETTVTVNSTSTSTTATSTRATTTTNGTPTTTTTTTGTSSAATTTPNTPTTIIGGNVTGTTSTSTLMAEVNRLRGVLNSLVQNATSSTVQPQGPGRGDGGTLLPQQTVPTYPAAGSTPAPMIVDTDSDGSIIIRGVVTDVTGNNMTITSWGGRWTIRTDATSSVVPRGTARGDLSEIEVGHFVGVDGNIATDRAFTVDATFVRDWTTNPYVAVAPTGTGGTGTGATGAPTNNGTTTNRTNGNGTRTSTTATPRATTSATSTINRAPTPTPTPTTPRATTTGTTSNQNGNSTTTNGGGFLRDLFGI